MSPDEPDHSKQKRTILQEAPSPINGWRIHQTLVAILEHASSGRHSHPGPEVGYIIQGDVMMHFDDRPRALESHSGSPFLIPPGLIHDAVNVGSVTTMMLSTCIIEETQSLVTMH